MTEFHKAPKRIEVSVGESVRIIRELQELTQNQLAELTGIPQSTISAIERNRVNLRPRAREGVGKGTQGPSCRLGLSELGRRTQLAGSSLLSESIPA